MDVNIGKFIGNNNNKNSTNKTVEKNKKKSKISNNSNKFDLNQLTKHAIVMGATGSGKTVLCKSIIEEAILNKIPIIAFDPKGDIGGLGIFSKNFNFRPFSDFEAKINDKTPEEFSKRLQEKYREELKKYDITEKIVKKYCETADVNIYTPKNKYGKQISIAPSLTPPENFKELYNNPDENISANLIEPIAESLVSLVGYPLSVKKEITLITKIIEHEWLKSSEKNHPELTLERLIKLIREPPFERIGALNIDAFISTKQKNNLVSKMNLLLTTPSLEYWFKGENINFDELFRTSYLEENKEKIKKANKSINKKNSKNIKKTNSKKTPVNIFDLRFIQDKAEKQFFVGRFLQELYKWLIKQQGTQKLKFILYFDEIKDYVPSFPNNPPSKKLIDIIIRQGRAFGLGCVFATQNPGDIDYKILSNINTRFIGKLRTQQDIDKVITGMNLDKEEIKIKLNELNTFEFLYNDLELGIVKNLHPRWLISYHRGPLSDEEIGLINKSITTEKVKKEEKIIKASVLSIPLKYEPEYIINSIQKNRDIKIIIEEINTKYFPILHTTAKIDLEKYQIKANLSLDSDLSKRVNKFVKSDIDEDKISTSLISEKEKAEEYLDRDLMESKAVLHLKRMMENTFYVSKSINFYDTNKKKVIKKNYKILKPELENKIKEINNRLNPKIVEKKTKINQIKKEINELEYSIDKNKKNRDKVFKKIENLKEKYFEIKDELKLLRKERKKELKKTERNYKNKFSDIYKIDIKSKDIETESRIIWLPYQEIKIKIKAKQTFRVTIKQNHTGIITLGFCNKCNKNIKEINDLFICNYCGKTFCKKHIHVDNITNKFYCNEHFEKCDLCHKKYGEDTLKECPVCGRKVCPDDLIQCPNCGNLVCKKCVNKKIFSKEIIGCKLCMK